MKRIFIVMFALLLSIAFTTTAFAAVATFCDTVGACTFGSSTFGGGEYRPSSKVTVNVTTTNGLAYCASSQHSGASTNQTAGRQFATTSISPQILFAPSETTSGPKPCADDKTPASITWSN
jgi:hypothetical protein